MSERPVDIVNAKLELWTSNSWRRFHFQHGGPACEPTKQNDGHPDLYFPGGPDGPVARRMLATWNALVGIATDDIEQFRQTAPAIALERARKETNELVEALRDACALLQGWVETKCPPSHKAEHRADLDKKRALLAKYPPKVPATNSPEVS